jgi:hypothetical protein
LASVLRAVVEREKFTGSSSIIAVKPSPEVGTRLVKQFCALGMGIGVYRGLSELDEYTFRIVAKSAMDTAPSRVESILRKMHSLGCVASPKQISDDTAYNYDTIRWVLQDLKVLNIVGKHSGVEGEYFIRGDIKEILDQPWVFGGNKKRERKKLKIR